METKWCGTCKTELPTTDFAGNRTRKDGLQSHCRTCKKTIQNRWYANNKDVHGTNVRRRTKEYREIAKRYVVDILENSSCTDCGDTRIEVFEFDHVRGAKRANVSKMVSHGYCVDTIQTEIDKCEIVCANCHRLRTFRRHGWNKYAP
jgi:hypothetical protein